MNQVPVSFFVKQTLLPELEDAMSVLLQFSEFDFAVL
jgi:hypothetical protein